MFTKFYQEENSERDTERDIDSEILYTYLEVKHQFSTLETKKQRRLLIDIFYDKEAFSALLKHIHIDERYFMELLINRYDNLFTPSFIKKYVNRPK